jgi:hypothetical protein
MPKKTTKNKIVKKVTKSVKKTVAKKSSVAKKATKSTNKAVTGAVKKIAKKKRKRTPKDKMYFTQATEDAIVKYNKEENLVKRNTIYIEEIKYAFEKLAENVYNTFKFSYFDSEPIRIQQQVVSFLVSNIHKYKPQCEGGSKAFSYFSVVAKNWLILQNNNTWKRWNQHTEIIDAPDEEIDGEILMQFDNENAEIKEFVNLMIEYWDENLVKIFNKRKEMEIANAVLELFKNREKIENFNKKTLYLYIREMSGCKTQNITKVINKMKEYQKDILEQYLSRGTVENSIYGEETETDPFFE